ncbi:AMP-binding protein, partial [Saccharothrix sp. MB29]|nr:AMP-binding protein [Saccharothrix sp. MB29]
QVVRAPSPVEWAHVDLTGEADRDGALARLMRDEAGFVFDLAAGPLLRPTLVGLGAEDHVLVLMMHHVIGDDWSNEVLLADLAAGYSARAPLPDPVAAYSDFARWQREHLTPELRERQLGYWRARLAGAVPTELAPDRPHRASSSGAARQTHLPAGLTAWLRRFSRERRVSLFTTLIAACQVLLARHSGARDVTVATAHAGRDRAEWADLAGMFVNTVVIRSTVDERRDFEDLLAAVRETVLDALDHADVPFHQVVRALAPDRDPGRTPLANVMVVMQNAPDRPRAFTGLNVVEVDLPAVAATFDLTLEFREVGDRLRVHANYRADRYEAATVDRLVAHLELLLDAVTTAPRRPLRLSGVPLPPVAEPVVPTSALPYELFAEWVERGPDQPAVVHGPTTVTYRELAARVDRLADHLDAGPETPVGVRVSRGPDLVAALLAVLKRGAAIVPLDPDHPPARLESVIRDTGTRVVITDDGPPDTAPGVAPVEVRPGNTAYVVHASGTTGGPKGVAVTHGALAENAERTRRRCGLGPGTRTPLNLSIGFDGGLWQALMPVFSGATVCVIDHEADLTDQVRRNGITTLVLPPALLSIMDPGAVPSVTAVYSAAEACPTGLAETWSRGRVFGNLYGPTETTITATAWVLEEGPFTGDSVPIGTPLESARCYVLTTTCGLSPTCHRRAVHRRQWRRARLRRAPGGTAERFVADRSRVAVPGCTDR